MLLLPRRFSDFVVREIAPDGSVARLLPSTARVAAPEAALQPAPVPTAGAATQEASPEELQPLVTAESKAAAIAALQEAAGPEARVLHRTNATGTALA